MGVSVDNLIGSWTTPYPPFTDQYGVFGDGFGVVSDPYVSSGGVTGFILLEDGSSYLLLQSGDKFLLE